MENKSIHEILLDIQENLKAPKNQYNSFGKYNYRSTEDIINGLKSFLVSHKCTIILTDEVIAVSERIYVKATATLSNGKDSTSVTSFAREPLQQKGMNEAQITGSASTYARKYALSGLFAIDDTKDSDHDSQSNSSESSYGLITDKQHQELRVEIQKKNLDYLTVCSNWNMKSLSELQQNSIVGFKEWLSNENCTN